MDANELIFLARRRYAKELQALGVPEGAFYGAD